MVLNKPRVIVERLWLLLVIALVAIVIDQISKRAIEQNLQLGESVDIASFLSPYLTFTYTFNTGAAFSMLQNANPFFMVLGIVVSAFIIYYVAKLPEHDTFGRVAFGLILGGILGNWLDRLRQGHVTDFIHFQIPQIGFDFAVFNGADSFLFIGVVLLFIQNLLHARATQQ